jgi:hypothetical protein
LNSKEIAVSLPVALAAYEFWVARDKRWSGVIATSAITVVWIAGKLWGPNPMTQNPAYSLRTAPLEILSTATHYVREVFLGWQATPVITAGLIVLSLVVAVISRRAALLWGWTLLAAGSLPVLLIEPRSPYALYVPLMGLVIYLADLIRWLTRERYPVAVFLAVALVLAPLEVRATPTSLGAVNEAQRQARESVEPLRSLLPAI